MLSLNIPGGRDEREWESRDNNEHIQKEINGQNEDMEIIEITETRKDIRWKECQRIGI